MPHALSTHFTTTRGSTLLATSLAAFLLCACAAPAGVAEGPLRKETVVAVTASNQLVRFNAGQPARILSKRALSGLQPGETVLGIDYRVAKGMLYAVGSSGRLYRVDAATGAASAVGAPFAVALTGDEFGVDFNPTVDRLRIASNSGMNLRIHPDTGAVVDGNATLDGVQTDGALAYVAGDTHFGKSPAVVAAAYTYNKTDEKITTNYALDAGTGALVMQGSMEGVKPAVSPNTGQLRTVGALNAGSFKTAAFDIADVSGAAFAALTSAGAKESRWVEVDLKTGAARTLGSIGGGEAVRGVAIEP